MGSGGPHAAHIDEHEDGGREGYHGRHHAHHRECVRLRVEQPWALRQQFGPHEGLRQPDGELVNDGSLTDLQGDAPISAPPSTLPTAQVALRMDDPAPDAFGGVSSDYGECDAADGIKARAFALSVGKVNSSCISTSTY